MITQTADKVASQHARKDVLDDSVDQANPHTAQKVYAVCAYCSIVNGPPPPICSVVRTLSTMCTYTEPHRPTLSRQP